MLQVQEAGRVNAKPSTLYSVDLSEQSLSVLEAQLNNDFKAYDIALKKFKLGKGVTSTSSTVLRKRASEGRGFFLEPVKDNPNTFRLSVYMD